MWPVAWRAYDEASQFFFETYESLRFSRMHRSFLRFLPPRGTACLDVGAGSGRDAAALVRRGYQVVAVEPSKGLRTLAKEHHTDPRITWVDDALPELFNVLARNEQYPFILLSAVWMHISPEQRIKSLTTLSNLLTRTGYIALTLRMGSPCGERVMYPVSVEELLTQADKVGLTAVYVSRKTRDSLKRSDVEWRKVVLTKQAHAERIASTWRTG